MLILTMLGCCDKIGMSPVFSVLYLSMLHRSIVCFSIDEFHSPAMELGVTFGFYLESAPNQFVCLLSKAYYFLPYLVCQFLLEGNLT